MHDAVSSKILKILVISLMVLNSCGQKTETQDPEQPGQWRILNAWGQEFNIIPIAELKGPSAANTDAIAKVVQIEGNFATGFFISPDGLFLTNHHVISPEDCSAERCLNTQFVRDFRPGGAQRSYGDFSLVAASKDHDFALLAVKLAPGEVVPHYVLSETFSENDYSKPHALHVIGHPGGASLMASTATLLGSEGKYGIMDLNAAALGGSSGSPILHNGIAVGQFHAINFHIPDTNRHNGYFRASGMGTSAKEIVRTLKTLFPDIATKSPADWRQSDFQKTVITEGGSKVRYARFFPKALVEWNEDLKLEISAFFRNFYGRPEEGIQIAAIHQRIVDRSLESERRNDLKRFYRSLWTADQSLRRKSSLAVSFKASDLLEGGKMTEALEEVNDTVALSLLRHTGELTYEACNQAHLEKFHQNSYGARSFNIIKNCAGLDDPRAALEEVNEAIRLIAVEDNDQEYVSYLWSLFSALDHADTLGLLQLADDQLKLRAVFKYLKRNAVSFQLYASADALETKYNHARK